MTSMRRNHQDGAIDPETGKLLDAPKSPSSPKMDEEDQVPQPESTQFDKHPLSPRYSPLKAIAACALYCCCSVSMVLVNKSLASRYVASSNFGFSHFKKPSHNKFTLALKKLQSSNRKGESQFSSCRLPSNCCCDCC